MDDIDREVGAAERRYDRLFVGLILDAARFEVAAADGATALLREMRAEARTTEKRCRLGLQAAGEDEAPDGEAGGGPASRCPWSGMAGVSGDAGAGRF